MLLGTLAEDLKGCAPTLLGLDIVLVVLVACAYKTPMVPWTLVHGHPFLIGDWVAFNASGCKTLFAPTNVCGSADVSLQERQIRLTFLAAQSVVSEPGATESRRGSSGCGVVSSSMECP
ncbi:hypothetical protein VE26_00770 [Devosia chinhatensis]|uniref:Uncharacterized protein n=1 Tax=Devosia chinhatensis TaxID=429727 RepID=A0A0F5FIE7_9HYPH|nr:hypothetical protein VE26_00770 [Devosia chinhatensis]